MVHIAEQVSTTTSKSGSLMHLSLPHCCSAHWRWREETSLLTLSGSALSDVHTPVFYRGPRAALDPKIFSKSPLAGNNN